MDIFDITDVRATSRGVIDIGSVTIYIGNQEFMFDTEEELINGNHDFKVFIPHWSDNKTLNLNVNNETGQILDEEFVNFIYEKYQELTKM